MIEWRDAINQTGIQIIISHEMDETIIVASIID